MKALEAIVVCMIAFATQHAVAAAPRNGPVRPVISKSRQAPGVHHPASSFAPHPGSKRRVYGAPIQRPILTSIPAQKAGKPK